MTAHPQSPAGNRLGAETSPYLLQHKDNPVDWFPWGDEAFARARAEDKPILLSIGYAACHWCHVMAHESFENPDIAALMNRLFVNIKVDREERPDLDQIYQSALAMMGQHGGWPLTMFLTPDGEPFWGGTYFPPTSRWGRPGFPDVLQGVTETYRREPDKVRSNVEALRGALSRLAENHAAGPLATGALDRVAERLVREIDPIHGGIGSAPKFPQPSILELLWRAWKRTGRTPYREAVLTTLTRMSQGGIYDHLGGGFARYSTDDRWLVPHFEKMLYDNAQLIDLLTWTWQETGERLFAVRVEETIGWVLREMIALDADGRPTGAFASTLDADSEGEEGRFYVWTEAEIDRLLGPDAARFKRIYDVTAEGNWEGVNILNRIAHPDLLSEEEEQALAMHRAILWKAREARVHPGWDDKILADWNGLMIAALANASFAFDRPDWLQAARDAFAFVRRALEEGDRLRHGWRHGVAKHAGTLDDHANMIRAAIALYETTGEDTYLDRAKAWTATLDRLFWDEGQGGYFYTAVDAERLIVRTKNVADNAVPAGNGTMVGVLARLWLLTGETAYRDRADALVGAFSGELARNVFPLSTFLNGAELLESGTQIVVVGRPDTGDTRAMLDVLRNAYLPNRVLTLLRPDQPLPDGHPAQGKGMAGDRATVYLCKDMTCRAPIAQPQELGPALMDV